MQTLNGGGGGEGLRIFCQVGDVGNIDGRGQQHVGIERFVIDRDCKGAMQAGVRLQVAVRVQIHRKFGRGGHACLGYGLLAAGGVGGISRLKCHQVELLGIDLGALEAFQIRLGQCGSDGDLGAFFIDFDLGDCAFGHLGFIAAGNERTKA